MFRLTPARLWGSCLKTQQPTGLSPISGNYPGVFLSSSGDPCAFLRSPKQSSQKKMQPKKDAEFVSKMQPRKETEARFRFQIFSPTPGLWPHSLSLFQFMQPRKKRHLPWDVTFNESACFWPGGGPEHHRRPPGAPGHALGLLSPSGGLGGLDRGQHAVGPFVQPAFFFFFGGGGS